MMEEGDIYFEKEGESLVKVNIVDDNNPSESTFAVIPQEYYERILSGQSSLSKYIDDEGKTQFMLVDNPQTESDSINTLNKVINNTTNLHTISKSEEVEVMVENLPNKDNLTEMSHIKNDSTMEIEENKLPVSDSEEHIQGEQFVITEYPSGENFYSVLITDSQGVNIYEKDGQVGDTVELELMGQTISYLISGNNEDGSVRQTNVFFDNSDVDKSADAMEHVPGQNVMAMEEGVPEDDPGQHETTDANEEEYVITEQTVIVDNQSRQLVTLADKSRTLLDKKYGVKGDSVKLQLTDKAFEYSIQGPMENGEPIVTTFLINRGDEEDEVEESEHHNSEVEDPAAQWCPPELNQEEYSAIREEARRVAAALESTSELPSVQPYSESLGSVTAYQELVSLVERYKSRDEERRTDLGLLRRHSKLYKPARPNARRLTPLEWARNEAAAQVCRYVPALLFHKRRLYECAVTAVERTGLFPNDTATRSDTRDELVDENIDYNDIMPVEEPHAAIAVGRSYPATTTIGAGATGAYISSDMSSHAFGQGVFSNFGKRDLQLTNNEETAIKNAAERQQEELYQYPIKPKSDCNSLELSIREEIPKLKTMFDGSASEVDQALDYLRETSMVNGRFLPSQRTRHQPLSPYDVAVNEAAFHLVRNNIGLLTFRKTLADLAKKVVRASGCTFRHNTMGDKNVREYNAANLWLYNQENVPELDLSPAVRVLSDSLEDGPLSSLMNSTFVPIIEETLVRSTSDDEEDEIYRPKEFRDKQLLGNVNLQCEPENNILNEKVIYCHTGTDELKKVRILDLAHCAFTSIMPIDINYCYNLVELNLFNNNISYLPRCLFLPNLIKLNLKKNAFITVPLLEQFPKLYSVELDDRVVRKLNRESLMFFCPELTYINDVKFEAELSDEFNNTLVEARTYIESMVQARWEEDLAMYFKKGVAKSEAQKVIETLVLSIRERKVFNEEKFFNFKDLVARRVAESFLDSKIIDDDEDDELKDKYEENEDEDDDEEESSEVSRTTRSRYQKKNDFDNQTVEKDQILLQDEPLDRLTNVVGQALRSGKTVVYSVMRTAARQPGGDLIPVGGGDSSQNNTNSYLLPPISKKSGLEGTAITAADELKKDRVPEPSRTRPGPASFKKRMYGIVETPPQVDTDEEIFTKESVQRVIDVVLQKVENFNTNNVKRRVGRPKLIKSRVEKPRQEKPVKETQNKENLENQKREMFKMPKSMQETSSEWPTDDGYDQQREKRERSPVSVCVMKKLAEIIRDCHQPIPPSKLREILGVPTRGRPPRYIKEASDRTYMKHNKSIPETPQKPTKPPNPEDNLVLETQLEEIPTNLSPHRPPPQSLKVTTRDSNRMKRFNPYGVRETNDNRSVTNFSSDNEERPSPVEPKDTNNDDYEYAPSPKQSKSTSISPTKSSLRTNSDNSDFNSEASFINELKRVQLEKEKEKPKEKRTTGTVVTLPSSSIFKPNPVCKGISINGKTPDYDPLHFIRCHARDNNPLDCTTKVWRCAFEPNPNNPYLETTSVVATCGGECVCLIDCRTGKVMKRFKSREEEFYTVAWTTVEMAGGHYINILAAAGKMKDIRLLHPEQLVCYAEMKGHEQEIACMTFHPRYPTVLFSGDAMATVLMWDIGIPSAPDYTTHYQLLTKLVCPRSHLNPVLNLVVMPSYDALITGCEDGVFVWLFPEFRKHRIDDIQSPDFEVKVPTHQEPCFDGLARLSESTFLVKCVEEGEIFTINFPQILQHYKARKFDDQNRIVADVIGQLRWQITDEIYINVTAQMNLGSVTCGDNEGTIWLYDMSKEVNDDNHTRKFKCKPAKILDWPECSVEASATVDTEKLLNPDTDNSVNRNPIINCVEMSSDGNFLVAVTDNNLVCIWSIPSSS